MAQKITETGTRLFGPQNGVLPQFRLAFPGPVKQVKYDIDTILRPEQLLALDIFRARGH